MGFHSDSEAGVQGTIASLSLGSPAGMRFRPPQALESGASQAPICLVNLPP